MALVVTGGGGLALHRRACCCWARSPGTYELTEILARGDVDPGLAALPARSCC